MKTRRGGGVAVKTVAVVAAKLIIGICVVVKQQQQ